MRVLCIGRVTYDISLPLKEAPIPGKAYNDVSKVEGGSGAAGTAAFLLGKWGVESYVSGVVGNDLYGNRIKREFETIGVFTKFLEVNYEKETIIKYVINNESNGSSISISGTVTDVKLSKTTYEMESPNGILIDGSEVEASNHALIRYKDVISVMNASDPTKEVIDLCLKVNHIICSLGFAEAVSGVKTSFENPQTLVQMYQTLKDKFKKDVIVTLGNRGALYAVGNDVRIMPAVKVTAKDDTGARDVFAGAFIYAMMAGRKYEVAIKVANMAAGISVSKVGIQNSIFKLEEVETFAKNINESIY